MLSVNKTTHKISKNDKDSHNKNGFRALTNPWTVAILADTEEEKWLL